MYQIFFKLLCPNNLDDFKFTEYETLLRVFEVRWRNTMLGLGGFGEKNILNSEY